MTVGNWFVREKTLKWELYNPNEDRSEMHNLAAQYPQKVAEMTKAYEAWAKRCMVEPYPGQKRNKASTQLIRKSTRLIILYLTPVGKYPMILHDRSFLYAFIHSLSVLHRNRRLTCILL